jgi:DNA-binding LacI/PurR family transcriptional regulator
LGDIRPPEIAARFAGANAAVQEAGLPALEALPVHLSGEQAQEDIATRIRRIGRTLDGIVCASDVIAMTALRALRTRASPSRRTLPLPASTICRSRRRRFPG